jgi:membrane protease YdiL (CAAX protease family)
MTGRRLPDPALGAAHFLALVGGMLVFGIGTTVAMGVDPDEPIGRYQILGQLAGQQVVVLMGITVLFVRTSRFQWPDVLGTHRQVLRWAVFVFLFTPGFLIMEDPFLDLWNQLGGFQQPGWYESTLVVDGWGSGVAIVGVVVILAALSEELVFRGYFMRRFASMGVQRAILLQAILFALFHFEPHGVPVYLFSGIVLGILRHVSGSIVPGIGFHALNNGLSVLDFNVGQTVLSEPTIWAYGMAAVMIAASLAIGRRAVSAQRMVPSVEPIAQPTPETKV